MAHRPGDVIEVLFSFLKQVVFWFKIGDWVVTNDEFLDTIEIVVEEGFPFQLSQIEVEDFSICRAHLVLQINGPVAIKDPFLSDEELEAVSEEIYL